jgi:hypothetical protein
MSFDALAWAAKQQAGSSGAKLVLLGLAECASRKGGLAFPSIAELVEFSCLNRKSVIANLAKLEAAGLIQDTGDCVGRTKQIKVYRLCLETVPKTGQSQKRNSSDFSANSPKNGTRNKSEPVGSEAKASSPKSAKQSEWHSLPVDWVPTRQLSQNTLAMVENWPPGAFASELESFRSWAGNAEPKKGKGLKKDWDDAFGNWIRTAHRDRYARIVRLERPRTNPLSEQYRAICEAASSAGHEDFDGAGPALPAPRYG